MTREFLIVRYEVQGKELVTIERGVYLVISASTVKKIGITNYKDSLPIIEQCLNCKHAAILAIPFSGCENAQAMRTRGVRCDNGGDPWREGKCDLFDVGAPTEKPPIPCFSS